MNTSPFEYHGQTLIPGKVYGIVDPNYRRTGLEDSFSWPPHYGMYLYVSHSGTYLGDVLFYRPWSPNKQNPDGTRGGWANFEIVPAYKTVHFLPLTTFAKKFPAVLRPPGFQTPDEVIAQAKENRWAHVGPAVKGHANAWTPRNRRTRRRASSLRRSTRKSK